MRINGILVVSLGLLFSSAVFSDCPDLSVYCYHFNAGTASPIPETNLSYKTGSKWNWKTVSCNVIRDKQALMQKCKALYKNIHSIVYPTGSFQVKADYAMADMDRQNNSIPSAGWMGYLGGQYRNFSKAAIKDIMLPGSHDSGTYNITIDSEYSPDGFYFVDELNILKSTTLANKIFANWSKTQPLKVRQQLEQGIRYFDIRLCARGSSVYICHGKYSVDFSRFIQDMKQFLDDPRYRQELVILDINHLYEMNPAHHNTAINELLHSFGSKIADKNNFGLDSALEDFWKNNKQVIIIYHDHAVRKAYPELWSSSTISSIWPDKTNGKDLINSLNANLERRLNSEDNQRFYVVQGILTEDDKIIIKSIYNPLAPSSLKEYTMVFKQMLYSWLYKKQDKLNQFGNIIIEDWITGRALTDFVIESNIKKFNS